MSEEAIVEGINQIKSSIKVALFQRNMKQNELAQLIGEGEPQVSQAIRGDMSPQSRAIRKKIYKILDIK